MTEILILISQLGNHYSSDFRMDMRLNVELDHLLKTYYNGDYDITEIMKNVCMSEQHHISNVMHKGSRTFYLDFLLVKYLCNQIIIQ
jgi:hypothetical protein